MKNVRVCVTVWSMYVWLYIHTTYYVHKQDSWLHAKDTKKSKQKVRNLFPLLYNAQKQRIKVDVDACG